MNTTIKPAFDVVPVGPVLAEDLLRKCNVKNRDLRINHAKDYARDMKNGDWLYAAQPIKFTGPSLAEPGQLLDGQHTLYAIVIAGVELELLCAFNVPPESQLVMDSGLRRSIGDNLGLRDVKDGTVLAAVARLVVNWQQGHPVSQGVVLTHSEAAKFVIGNEALAKSGDVARAVTRRLPRVVPPSAVGAAHYILSALGPDDAEDFFDRFADGHGLTEGHPVGKLRERLLRIREESRGTGRGARSGEHLALIVRAWNAYRDGETVSKLQLPKFGLTDESFPVPK